MIGTSPHLGRHLCRVGSVAGAVLAVLTSAWVATLVLVPGPPVDATLADKLAYLAGRPETAIGPALVVGIALLFVPVWLGLAAVVWSRRPAAGVLAVAFGVIYAPLASINYWSQLTVVRGLAELSRTDPAGAVAAYRLFEFPAGLTSLAYGIDVFAYVVWGIAALAVAIGLLPFERLLARTTAGLFAAGGILAIAGGVGFVVESDALELGVLLSGVAALLAVIAAVALQWRSATDEASLSGGLSFEVRVGPVRP